MGHLHVDFESYSEAPLTGPKSVGAWAYSAHKSTRVLMMAYAFNDERPKLWTPGQPLPDWVGDLGKKDPGFQICAWNDFFEYCIMRNCLKWPTPSPKYWCDVAASAAALALPRALGNCGAALGLPPEFQKDKEGDGLIKIFSVPRRHKGACFRTLPKDKPEEFEKFKEYCLKDVVSERYIFKVIKSLPKSTRKMWELDRKVNLRGLRIDMPSVHNAIIIRDMAADRKIKEVQKLTGGELTNVKSPAQVKSYLGQLEIHLENAQAEYLKRKVKELKQKSASMYSTAIKIIEARLFVGKSALAKYDKLLQIIPEGDRAFGLLRFHGALTGRWSGNLFQPQNLPRPSIKNAFEIIPLLAQLDPDLLRLFYGDAMEALSSALRSIITASTGCRLVVSDFKQIESRFIRWLAGDEKGLDKYREGLDIYKVNASSVFKTPYDAITSDQRLIGKVIELACGYQGGVRAFQSFADVYGVIIPDEQAKSFIKTWRAANPKIVNLWNNLEAAALLAVKKPGTVHAVRGIKYTVRGTGRRSFLYCQLPSGRLIAYHRPHLSDGPYGKQQIRYWGVDSRTKKYTRLNTYGGKLAENVTQAGAADRLWYSMHKIENAGYPIVMTVHDEIITDTPNGHGSIDHFNSIMRENPEWCAMLPVDADGYEAERYRK